MMKLVHPQDIISRVFMLDYLREIPAEEVFEVADINQKKKLFYRFEYEVEGETKMKYDYNWEELMFHHDLVDLEELMTKLLPLIENIDAKREVVMKMKLEELEQTKATADINVMDLAQTMIEKANNPGVIYGAEK